MVMVKAGSEENLGRHGEVGGAGRDGRSLGQLLKTILVAIFILLGLFPWSDVWMPRSQGCSVGPCSCTQRKGPQPTCSWQKAVSTLLLRYSILPTENPQPYFYFFGICQELIFFFMMLSLVLMAPTSDHLDMLTRSNYSIGKFYQSESNRGKSQPPIGTSVFQCSVWTEISFSFCSVLFCLKKMLRHCGVT